MTIYSPIQAGTLSRSPLPVVQSLALLRDMDIGIFLRAIRNTSTT
jgi:hypothetical protein